MWCECVYEGVRDWMPGVPVRTTCGDWPWEREAGARRKRQVDGGRTEKRGEVTFLQKKEKISQNVLSLCYSSFL